MPAVFAEEDIKAWEDERLQRVKIADGGWAYVNMKIENAEELEAAMQMSLILQKNIRSYMVRQNMIDPVKE